MEYSTTSTTTNYQSLDELTNEMNRLIKSNTEKVKELDSMRIDSFNRINELHKTFLETVSKIADSIKDNGLPTEKMVSENHSAFAEMMASLDKIEKDLKS